MTDVLLDNKSDRTVLRFDGVDAFGQRYDPDVFSSTEQGTAIIRSAWIIRVHEYDVVALTVDLPARVEIIA